MSADQITANAQTKPEPPTFGRELRAPGAYSLDLATLVDFPLKYNGEPSTFAQVYGQLQDTKILKMPEWTIGGVAKFETDSGEVTITGDGGHYFVVSVLRDLIELHSEGINPHRATWFYYEHDWSRDADEIYMFFVVHSGKIVRERFSLMHCYPRVLTKDKVDDEPTWHAQPYQHEAWEAYWYRMFYTETMTGKLMVLRPDEPILYCYERTKHDVTRDIELVTLVKSYRLLWIAVALLVAIAFPIAKLYMAAFAAILFVDLVFRVWTTRNVGRT